MTSQVKSSELSLIKVVHQNLLDLVREFLPTASVDSAAVFHFPSVFLLRQSADECTNNHDNGRFSYVATFLLLLSVRLHEFFRQVKAIWALQPFSDDSKRNVVLAASLVDFSLKLLTGSHVTVLENDVEA